MFATLLHFKMRHLRRINLDFMGFSASLLCAIHCAAVPVILTSAALNGFYWVSNPLIEMTIIFFSFVFAAVSLTKGFTKHHRFFLPVGIAILGFFLLLVSHVFQPFYEAVFTCIAGISIATAHLVNYRLVRKMVILSP